MSEFKVFPAIDAAVADPNRLAALFSYNILDTPAEEGFDDIVQLATQICGAPVALVSLVAGDRQWFKARVGFPPCETGLNSSVCAHALVEPDLLIIPDLSTDPRTRDNPLVTGDPYIQFYAGAPLRTADGQVLGSLCVIDRRPRPEGLSEARKDALRALARQVVSQLELRRSLINQRRILQQREALIGTQTAISHARGDLDAVLDALIAGAMQALPHAEGGVVELREGDALIYRRPAGTIGEMAGLSVPVQGSLVGSCALTGEPILCHDVLEDGRVKHDLIERLKLRSCVVVPVVRQDAIVGVLKLQSSKAHAFSEADLSLMQVFAGAVTAGLAEAGEAEARRIGQRSEGRYKAVFESAIDYAIIVLSLDGHVTDWNAGATKILGWDHGEMCGRHADTFFTPEDREEDIPEKEMRAALDHGRGVDERWHLRQSGERFWANGEMMVLRDEAGAAIGFVKMLRDRTEQRLAAEALQNQSDLLQTITDHVGQAVFQMDCQGLVTFANPAAEVMFGWSADELIGQSLHDALHHSHPDGRPFPAGDCPLVHALRDGRVIRERKDTFFHRSGRPVQVLATNAPVYVGGKVTSAVVTVSDITARQAVEQALSASEARWRGLFTNMQEGFFVGEVVRDANAKPVDYRFLEINPAFSRQSGLPLDCVGRTIRDFVPDFDQALVDTCATVVETGEPALLETQIPGLHRWFEIRVNPDGGQRFTCLFLDVSSRKTSEIQQAALIELGDRLRDLRDKADIAAAAGEIAGRTLGLDRAGYGSVDQDVETVTIERDWTAPGITSLAGLHRFREYGSYIEALKRGETVVVNDIASDRRTQSDPTSWAAIGVHGLINIPVMEQGRFVGLLFMLSGSPRVWTAEEIGFLRNLADRTRAAIARVEAETRQDLINHELSHRMKNLLAMVQSIATQTMRNATDVNEAKEVLAGRLIALGKAHDLLMGGALTSTEMEPVIRGALEIHQDRSDRFQIEGPSISIGPDQALSLALMLHELATNATKYGALSTPSGQVVISWDVRDPGGEPALHFLWAEAGGPPVVPPKRKGFGSRFIERGLVSQVRGELALEYPATGVTCALSGPLIAFQVSR